MNELNILKDIKASGYKGLSILHDWGETDRSKTYQINEIENKSKFMIMTKLGRELSSLFFRQKKKLKKIDILKIGIQLMKNVEKLHTLGYIHRDIKPDNILLEHS